VRRGVNVTHGWIFWAGWDVTGEFLLGERGVRIVIVLDVHDQGSQAREIRTVRSTLKKSGRMTGHPTLRVAR
jgi:hypothetical protein